jgi:hypothetical protein
MAIMAMFAHLLSIVTTEFTDGAGFFCRSIGSVPLQSLDAYMIILMF